MDLYVYYRVRHDDAAVLRPQVEAMQQDLSHRFSVSCALKRRPEEKDGCQTWMETYLDIPAVFADELAQSASRLALINGERHVETFVDLASCA